MTRILIVDDQATIRFALQSRLQSYPDFEIVGLAENGRQALEKIAQFSPNVILLDLEMPILDGYETAREIQKRFPHTKVLILTSHEKPQALVSALEAGVHGYFLKSAPAAELANAIRAVSTTGQFQLGEVVASTMTASIAPLKESAATMVVSSQRELLTQTGSLSNEIVSLENSALTVQSRTVKPVPFDRPVILQRSPLWTRFISWSIITSTIGIIVWACLAKIDSAVLATGQLSPQGAVKEVKPPVSGVVKEIFVRDGQRVKKGDVLLSLDPKGTNAELKSLQSILNNLQDENAFYKQQTQHLRGVLRSPAASERIPLEMRSLADSREALIRETQLYRAQIYGDSAALSLSPEQEMRLQSNVREESSRASAAKLEIVQLQKQLLQNQILVESSRKSVNVNEVLISNLTPVVEQGGVPRNDLLRQQEALQKSQADVARYEQENARIQALISQAAERVDNTVSLSRKDLLTAIANNEKQIADIDGRFSKAIIENEKQIAETQNRLSQAQLTLRYQELKSPTDGVVFDLKATSPGYIANTNSNEPILKLVPSETLLAKVYITNKDIGFIRVGMPVDVRIDSYPLSEFGDIKGELTWIGSDALEPTPQRQFYSFPATIKLVSQTLKSKENSLALQSGMSISANIKTRQRTVITLLTDLFTGQTESMKNLR